jgi:hypothetical protein
MNRSIQSAVHPRVYRRVSECFRGRWTLIALLVLALWPVESEAAVMLGSQSNFAYTYSPRLALGLDTNALNEGVAYVRESPVNFNCSYVAPASSATPARGTVTYDFRTDAGFVIQDISLLQRATLYTSGFVTGEYSTNGGLNYQPFFSTPVYDGSTVNFAKQIRFHHLNASRLLVRYTIERTGTTRSVQLQRDCDDNPSVFAATGTIISQTNAAATRGRALINQGASWRYRDDGSDQGTAWRQRNFDDSQWPIGSAEFGYGERDEVTTNQFGPNPADKFVTTYYRTSFVHTNIARFKRVMVGLLRDDGAIVYLNGVEVFRSNMPGGTIGYATLASSAVDGVNETTFFQSTINPTNIVRGTNMVAVEVHQQRVDSSDISFDLDLWGELDVDPPVLNIQRAEGCAILSWAEDGFGLEWASGPRGPWEAFMPAATSPFTVCDQQTRTFFRLKQK